MTDAIGPGHTVWRENEKGGIDVVRHNDPAWVSHFLGIYDFTPIHISYALRKAYNMGRADQAALVRNAVNYGERT